MHAPFVETPAPLWAQLATVATGLACMFARRILRVVRERAKAARQYRMNGIGRLRALWRAVTL